MKLKYCSVCSSQENLHHELLIPEVQGGSRSDEYNLLTLCHFCRAKFYSLRENIATIAPTTIKQPKPRIYATIREKQALAFDDVIRPHIEYMLTLFPRCSYQVIARHLNSLGLKTFTGTTWKPANVFRIMNRLRLNALPKTHVPALERMNAKNSQANHSWQSRFVSWCQSKELVACPATVPTIIAWLDSTHVKSLTSLKASMCAIGRLHRENGYTSPTYHPMVTEVRQKKIKDYEDSKIAARKSGGSFSGTG